MTASPAEQTGLGWPDDTYGVPDGGLGWPAAGGNVSRETSGHVADDPPPADEPPSTSELAAAAAIAARGSLVEHPDAGSSASPNGTGDPSGWAIPVSRETDGGATGAGADVAGSPGAIDLPQHASAGPAAAGAGNAVSRETSATATPTDDERAVPGRSGAGAPTATQDADPSPGPETSGADAVAAPVRGPGIADPVASVTDIADADTPLAAQLADESRRREALGTGELPAPATTRILTVANQKGGVGKTTTTVNIGAALAQAGLHVLVIDIDPQGNASTALGIEHHAEVPSIYDVLVDGEPMTKVIQECPDVPRLWCAPATIDLAGAEIELVSMVARETRLRRAIGSYLQARRETGQPRLDYVLVDCPPSLGLLTVNAFVAAEEVLIPIQCEYYALEGLSALLNNISLIKNHLNPDLHVSTILMTMYDGRTRLSAQVADDVRAHFPDQVLRASVPRSVRISEAPSHGQTVLTYDPSSSGSLSYREAASEIARRGAEMAPR